jgi:hypothetical protein
MTYSEDIRFQSMVRIFIQILHGIPQFLTGSIVISKRTTTAYIYVFSWSLFAIIRPSQLMLHFLEICKASFKYSQDRQCTYNVTLRRVHETNVVVEKQCLT